MTTHEPPGHETQPDNAGHSAADQSADHPAAEPGVGPDSDPDGGRILSPQDEVFLADAARSLRTSTDPRWVEVSSRVLSTALRATRRSRRLRAHTPPGSSGAGSVYVSEQVLIAHLRDALDGRIPGTAVAALHLEVTGRDICTGVVIELIVQYRTTILPVADLARARAGVVLHELLGPPDNVDAAWINHVHVSDVTIHNPQTQEPTSDVT